MKQFFLKLNICSKTAFVSLIALLVFELCFFWLCFINLYEYFNGALLGIAVNTFSFFLIGLGMKKDTYKMGYTIALTVVRFLLIGATLFVSAYLYYKLDTKIINVFAVLGGYVIPFVIYLILYLKKGE